MIAVFATCSLPALSILIPGSAWSHFTTIQPRLCLPVFKLRAALVATPPARERSRAVRRVRSKAIAPVTLYEPDRSVPRACQWHDSE
ncbi:hypothetical protein C8Q76DRAFT_318861 [Earliella scabrosa]|nr:hypothetical protein C8Q76DRAFT_318861 [Earliella scabrosa]